MIWLFYIYKDLHLPKANRVVASLSCVIDIVSKHFFTPSYSTAPTLHSHAHWRHVSSVIKRNTNFCCTFVCSIPRCKQWLPCYGMRWVL